MLLNFRPLNQHCRVAERPDIRHPAADPWYRTTAVGTASPLGKTSADCEEDFMPHIPLNPGLPGIVGLLAFRPETAEPLNRLAEVLLRGPSSLTVGERELIAAVVSTGTDC